MNSTNSTNSPNSPKRPPSVWIAQLILGLLAAVWLWAGLWNIYYMLRSTGPIRPSVFNIVSMIPSLALSIVFIIGCLGLWKRKKYGRWIAIGGLSLVFTGGVLNSFAAFNRYPDTAKALGAFVVGLIVFGPIGFLAYRLARGGPANAFFSGTHPGDTENTEDTEKEFQQDGQD